MRKAFRRQAVESIVTDTWRDVASERFPETNSRPGFHPRRGVTENAMANRKGTEKNLASALVFPKAPITDRCVKSLLLESVAVEYRGRKVGVRVRHLSR